MADTIYGENMRVGKHAVLLLASRHYIANILKDHKGEEESQRTQGKERASQSECSARVIAVGFAGVLGSGWGWFWAFCSARDLIEIFDTVTCYMNSDWGAHSLYLCPSQTRA